MAFSRGKVPYGLIQTRIVDAYNRFIVVDRDNREAHCARQLINDPHLR